jgi:uncharacterized protein (TIGR02453 family)
MSAALAARNFSGFPQDGFAFLRELAANNDPAWFKPRKGRYEADVRGPAVALAADILSAAAAAKLPLDGDPGKAVFRIYRDVRFSPDKRPYKTHAGIVLTRTGQKSDPGLLYIHIEPGGCFLAAGFYQPDPPMLAALRQAIIADARGFLALVKRLDTAGLPLGADPDAVKRLPRGCEAAAGTPAEPFVKSRSLVIRRHVADAEARDPALVATVIDFYRSVQPLLAFGWRAIGGR